MKIVGEWDDYLVGCPSQCYLKVEHDGEPYTLYLRWRWSDPWRGKILMGHYPETKGVLKDGLLEDAGVYAEERELDRAKEAIIAHAKSFFNWLKLGKCLRCGNDGYKQVYSMEFKHGCVRGLRC